jgi:hypothetical protein
MYTEWVGQVQFQPQLMGYIEGAPPIPGENLKADQDYTGASSIKFIQADKTTSTCAASRNTGFDMSVEGSASGGLKTKTDLNLGAIIQKGVELESTAGVRATFEYVKSWLESATVVVGKQRARTISMVLRGHWDQPDRPRLFIPDNKRLALVKSSTADVFALRLKSNNALISYQMLPNPDIPEDWNIIMFEIDPNYVQQGMLGGNAAAYSNDQSYFKPVEAYRLKNRLEREEAELRTYFDQYAAGAIGQGESAERSGTMLTQGGSDLILKSKLASGLANRATNIKYLQDPDQNLAKRNLVNTYVWTADGGLFAETVQTMDSLQEKIGGSYKFKGMGEAPNQHIWETRSQGRITR